MNSIFASDNHKIIAEIPFYLRIGVPFNTSIFNMHSSLKIFEGYP